MSAFDNILVFLKTHKVENDVEVNKEILEAFKNSKELEKAVRVYLYLRKLLKVKPEDVRSVISNISTSTAWRYSKFVNSIASILLE